jgi:hypothetical protein
MYHLLTNREKSYPKQGHINSENKNYFHKQLLGMTTPVLIPAALVQDDFSAPLL